MPITFTVFRIVHSIYEQSYKIPPCVVSFTTDNFTTDNFTFDFTLVFDTFDYLLKYQFDNFVKSSIYVGNTHPLNISELVSKVIDIINENYTYNVTIEIVKYDNENNPYIINDNVFVEKLSGMRKC